MTDSDIDPDVTLVDSTEPRHVSEDKYLDKARKKAAARSGRSTSKTIKARAKVAEAAEKGMRLTPYQHEIVDDIRNRAVTFLAGEAGTGKTVTAVAAACREYVEGRAIKIQICRPAVAAGEELGFLPGTAQEKVHPFLVPVFDALKVLKQNPESMIQSGALQVLTLAHLRGLTIQGIAILDEAQNCTAQQLELFISRLGYNGRMIITGDPTQSDLHGVPSHKNPFGLLLAGMRNVQEVSEDVRVWDFDPAEHNQRHLALPGLLSVMKSVFGRKK